MKDDSLDNYKKYTNQQNSVEQKKDVLSKRSGIFGGHQVKDNQKRRLYSKTYKITTTK